MQGNAEGQNSARNLQAETESVLTRFTDRRHNNKNLKINYYYYATDNNRALSSIVKSLLLLTVWLKLD